MRVRNGGPGGLLVSQWSVQFPSPSSSTTMSKIKQKEESFGPLLIKHRKINLLNLVGCDIRLLIDGVNCWPKLGCSPGKLLALLKKMGCTDALGQAGSTY